MILTELAEAESRRKPAFRHAASRMVIVNDCHFSLHPYDAPMVCLEQAPDRTYHTSLDRPQNLSRAHLRRVGRMVARALLCMADGSYAELRALAERVYIRAARGLRKPEYPSALVMARTRKIMHEIVRLASETIHTPNAEDVARMRKAGRLIDGCLSPRAALERDVERLLARLAAQQQSSPAPAATPPLPPPPDALLRAARRLVPQKMFAGYLGGEDLHEHGLAKAEKEAGFEFGWGAAGWMQWAADLSNGKRSLVDIHRIMQAENINASLDRLLLLMKFLKRKNYVRFRPVLKKKDLLAALRRAGIARGDVLMAHTSLSAFGYFEGGADGVIDCLLEAVGPRGTLAVPTHSLNWIGARPYDPATSPSLVGAITNAFLKRPGAIRSNHPTHSAAAIGPQAAELVAGHEPATAPQGREGFWGHLVDADGKILLMCKLSSNTLLHAGELWAGTPYPPSVTHYMRDGVRHETITPGMPWHVESFIPVHESLMRRGKMKKAALGESSIYSMRARDGVETMMRMIRANPYFATRGDCRCSWCGYIRKHLAARERASNSKTAAK